MAKMRTRPGATNEFEALEILNGDGPWDATISFYLLDSLCDKGLVVNSFSEDNFFLTLKGHWTLFKYKLTKV
jgi:hypothetical protein